MNSFFKSLGDPNGPLAKFGEQVPVLNQVIETLHENGGHRGAAERARNAAGARVDLDVLLGRDGVVARVAEVIPGANIIAAELHVAAGNHEEAARARDLQGNQARMGDRDGALAHIAELLPGADMVAFGLHLKGGNYGQALRALVKNHVVEIRFKCIRVEIKAGMLEGLEVRNLSLSSLEVNPPIAVNALQMLHHFAKFDGSGLTRAAHRQCADALLDQGIPTIEKMCLENINDQIKTRIKQTMQNIPGQIEDAVKAKAEQVQELRRQSKVVEFLTPEVVPEPDALLTDAIQRAVQKCLLTHDTVEQVEQVKPADPQGSQYRLGSQQGYAEGSAALACICLLKFLLFGGSGGMGLCMAALSGFLIFRRWARRHVMPMVNAMNVAAWDSVVECQTSCKGVKRRKTSSEEYLTAPPVKMKGVVVDLPSHDVQCIATLLREYIFSKYFASHWMGKVLSFVESFVLRPFAGSLTEAETVPLVLNVPVPGVLSEPLEVALVLGLRPRFGPYVSTAKVVIPDHAVDRVLQAKCDEVKNQDMRNMDNRLEAFTEPLKVAFQLEWNWEDKAEDLVINIKDLKTSLHLPKNSLLAATGR